MICIQVFKKYVNNNDSYLIHYFSDLIFFFDWQRTSPKLSPSESALKRHRPDTVYVQIQKLGPKETFVSHLNGLILIPFVSIYNKVTKKLCKFWSTDMFYVHIQTSDPKSYPKKNPSEIYWKLFSLYKACTDQDEGVWGREFRPPPP